MLTNDAQGLFRADNHGWFFGWTNGTLFQARGGAGVPVKGLSHNALRGIKLLCRGQREGQDLCLSTGTPHAPQS